MKNAYKILTLCFCVFLLLTACQNAGKQEKITANEQKQASADTINTTQKTENEKQDKNNKIQEANNKTTIAIPVNPNNCELKKAYVNKDKLIEYINQADSHEYFYEDFKDTVGLEIAELFDEAEDFDTNLNINVVSEHILEFTPLSSYYKRNILIDKNGNNLVDDKNIQYITILDENHIICKTYRSRKDAFLSSFYLYDNKGTKIKKLGDFSYFFEYNNILIFVSSSLSGTKKYSFYNLKKDAFIDFKIKLAEEYIEHIIKSLEYENSPFILKSIKKENYFNDYIFTTKALHNTNSKDKTISLKNPIIEGDYIVGYSNEDDFSDRNIKIYDKRLNEQYKNKFTDFYYLGDEYYACIKKTENSYKKPLSLAREYQLNAILNKDKLSKVEYFYLHYLGNNLFYVYDNENYKFVNMKTKQVIYPHVQDTFYINDFKVYDDLIVGTNYYGENIFITNENYMILGRHFKNNKFEVISKINNNNQFCSLYPYVMIDDKNIQDNINNEIAKIFSLDKSANFFTSYDENNMYINKSIIHNFFINYFNNFLTIRKRTSIYTNQQLHSEYYYSNYVFDLENGNIIDEDYLFTDYEKARLAIIEELARQTITMEKYKTTFAYQWLVDKNMSAEKVFYSKYYNFALTKSGFEILFNPYEVSSFGAGAITYTIPYDVIKPYLKDEAIRRLEI